MWSTFLARNQAASTASASKSCALRLERDDDKIMTGRGGRGRGREDEAMDSVVNPNLPRCWVYGKKRPKLMADSSVSRTITKIFKKNIYGDGVNWKCVPDSYKEEYFQEFKKHFRWDPSTEFAVRTAFMNQASDRYSDMVNGFKSNSDKPACMEQDDWEVWLEFWSLPEVVEKSEKARQNRYSEKAGPGTGCSRHSGGSRSAHEHSVAMEKETGRAPHAYDCFLILHTKKDGTFVDERSRRIAPVVEQRAAAARAAAGDDSVDMTQIYLEVVGGVEKQRVFGVGSQADQYVDIGRPARPAQVNEESLKRQITEELQQQMSEQFAVQRQEFAQQMAAQRQEMEQQMRMLEEMYLQGLLPHPSGLDA